MASAVPQVAVAADVTAVLTRTLHHARTLVPESAADSDWVAAKVACSAVAAAKVATVAVTAVATVPQFQPAVVATAEPAMVVAAV